VEKSQKLMYIPVSQLDTPEYQRDVLAKHPIQKNDFELDKAGVLLVFERDNGRYMVGDGLQRKTRAEEINGKNYELPCFVYSGRSFEEEGVLFNTWNGDRKPVSATQIFRVQAMLGDKEANDILNILSEEGFALGDGKRGGSTFTSPQHPRQVYRYGTVQPSPDNLRTALQIMRGAYGKGSGAHGYMLCTVGRLLERYTVDSDAVSLLLMEYGTPKEFLDSVPGAHGRGGHETLNANYLAEKLGLADETPEQSPSVTAKMSLTARF
jgi:hypothetical protein